MTLDPIESGSPFHWCNIFVCNTETRVRQGSRIAVARSYRTLLCTRPSSIICRTTHIPHMNLTISVNLELRCGDDAEKMGQGWSSEKMQRWRCVM